VDFVVINLEASKRWLNTIEEYYDQILKHSESDLGLTFS